ncbi:cation:proton antiporter [Marinicella litoralis]|uniref:Transporter (CPA2 family) n=1 Tax=Marinicella litoralis TaxID=644220 RepID=A0A4V3DHH8_9GAMM|nr:cation:proton antiporter [Marinicella litoralis]TDR18271.1 transporter (CPA2 family) [Marinicella litoralis]
MDFAWVALALNDLIWIGFAFTLGLVSKKMGLPPMVGFLMAGFLLSTQNIVDQNLLKKMADLGITLLLFTIGLKINIRNLLRPQVWGVTMIHTTAVVVLVGLGIFLVSLMGSSLLMGLTIQNAALLAFALSFSSTVFVVKALEDKGEMDALHGRIAIGVLIIQDIFAVVFLAVSTGELPSVWALSLVLLIPFRFVLLKILDHVGHGELLILYGFLLAIGGAEVFELVGVKGDLGALIFGTMIATHGKTEELVKTMFGFKDLFLLGFFLSIGFNGLPDFQMVALALLLTPIALLKGGLFFALFVRFKLRSRTALLSTFNLSNYSEFGLIVIAIGVGNDWINKQWMIVMALTITFSFIISSLLNKHAHHVYTKYRRTWKRFQTEQRLDYDQLLNLGSAEIAVIGMGAVGTGTYDKLIEKYPGNVVGVDIDANTVKNQCAEHRNVILGDPSDADFWDRVIQSEQLKLVLLTLPQHNSSVAVVDLLLDSGYKGQIAAIAKFADEIEQLKQAGVHTVYNVHTEAGAGFASNVIEETQQTQPEN